MSEKHIFALFCKGLSSIFNIEKRGIIELIDKDLVNRVFKILRIKNGEQLTLFDEAVNLDIEIVESKSNTKNKLVGRILRFGECMQVLPEITLMPCILKKEAFEEVIYTAAQMAATRIIPILSAKVQRRWGGQKEFERLDKIMISACEQSKNFAIPELCNPINIQDLAQQPSMNDSQIKAYFDPAGSNFLELLQEISQKPEQEVALLFGPEGGLTCEEEKIATEAGFKVYALTSTILRSREAVVVGLGGVRSIAR